MPNWVYNTITVENDEDLAKVLAAVKSDDNEFDFEKLVPSPNDAVYHGKDTDNPGNWYRWNAANWGTKWNAGSVEIEDGNIRFDTAWSPPEPIFDALSAMFPDIKFNIHWEEEQGFGEEFDLKDGVRVQVGRWGLPESDIKYREVDIYEVPEGNPKIDAGFYLGYPQQMDFYDEDEDEYSDEKKGHSSGPHASLEDAKKMVDKIFYSKPAASQITHFEDDPDEMAESMLN